MKVCTDACLFGAWVAQHESIVSARTLLDIGTGTGLLSLMLAQATVNTAITGIEIENAAATEASNNFALSPWSSRLNVLHGSIQEYNERIIKDHLSIHNNEVAIKLENTSVSKFDCIVTNPPFFEGDLKSPNEKKNLASHSAGLPWNELTAHVASLLIEGGSYFVLIPALRAYTMQKLSETNGLQLVEEVLVYNSAKNLPIRAMQKFIKPLTNKNIEAPIVERSKIIIKDTENKYDPVFTALLQDYYLHL